VARILQKRAFLNDRRKTARVLSFFLLTNIFLGVKVNSAGGYAEGSAQKKAISRRSWHPDVSTQITPSRTSWVCHDQFAELDLHNSTKKEVGWVSPTPTPGLIIILVVGNELPGEDLRPGFMS
jgi:hypothetical protein